MNKIIFLDCYSAKKPLNITHCKHPIRHVCHDSSSLLRHNFVLYMLCAAAPAPVLVPVLPAPVPVIYVPVVPAPIPVYVIPANPVPVVSGAVRILCF